MPEYELRLRFTAGGDFQAWRLAKAWADTCAAEYDTRFEAVLRVLSDDDEPAPRGGYQAVTNDGEQTL